MLPTKIHAHKCPEQGTELPGVDAKSAKNRIEPGSHESPTIGWFGCVRDRNTFSSVPCGT